MLNMDSECLKCYWQSTDMEQYWKQIMHTRLCFAMAFIYGIIPLEALFRIKKKNATCVVYICLLPTCPPIHDLASVPKPFTIFSWNLVQEFFTKICRGSISFMKIGTLSHTLVKGVNIFLPVLSILVDQSEWSMHVMLASNCEFHENWGSEKYTLPNKIFPTFITFLSSLDNVQYRDVHKTYWMTVSFAKITQ